MLKAGIIPDFILLHYGGLFNKLLRIFRFLHKTVRQYRLKSIAFLLKKFTTKESGNILPEISDEDYSRLRSFLKSSIIYNVRGINDKSTIRRISGLGESIIVCNSGILKSNVLKIDKVIFLNIHSSKLPHYRGMNNIEWALFESSDIYVTVHRISRGMDEGDTLAQKKIDISCLKPDNLEDLRQKVFSKSYEYTGEAISAFLSNRASFTPQTDKNNPLMQYYSMHPILKEKLWTKIEKKNL
jgi:folate-dependent phosphoribosylglycinamide formyltransferase PurN